MRRVLRPGGHALVFVPAFMFLWGVQDDISHHRRRYTLDQLKRVMRQAGFRVERASYVNISFFAPILFGRLLMRAFRIRPESENNITIGFLNGLLGKLFDYLLSNPPFGVEWKKIEAIIRKEFEQMGFNGRFGPGLPRVSDGSLPFRITVVLPRPAGDRPTP